MSDNIKRLMLNRHPILWAIYDAVQAIEACGASVELTNAVVATTRLSEMAATILDERDEARAQLDVEVSHCAKETARLKAIEVAARALADEGQEYAFDDIGLGRGAPNSYWEDLDEALEPDTTVAEEAVK